jgi:hypothetical protein
MKRSFLMSALVLALSATMVPACNSGNSEGAKEGGDAKQEGGGESSGDPVTDLQKVSDDIQKAVDDVFAPIKNADAVIQSVADLPKDLKALKSKADPKKVLAELKGLLDGKDPNLDPLKLEDDAKAKVQERIDKVKALVSSIKNLDQAVKDLGTKITDAATKVPAIGAKAIAKVEITLKNPLAGGDAKKKAEEDKTKITGIIDGFKGKVGEWQKLITDMPAKAKDIPTKMAGAFKG